MPHLLRTAKHSVYTASTPRYHLSMQRTEQVATRITADLRERLIAAAREDDRSLASLVQLALEEWLADREAKRAAVRPKRRGKRT